MTEFGPKKISFADIGINSLGALISGFIGSIIIILIIFMTSSFISVPGTFEQAQLGGATNSMFPFILSFITFIATLVSFMLSVKFLSMTSPEKYKSNAICYGQIGFFGILLYLCITPIYIYMGVKDYSYIMIIFIFHSLLLSFGISLLLEILNNYRYILIGFYGSFIGLFFTSIITLGLFNSFDSGKAKLFSLLIILPLTHSCMTLFKGLFEKIYYFYFQTTNLDGLGDIFYRIEQEEKEALKEEEMKNNL